ncbi:DNA repair protein RAD50.L-like isoform X2 [Watersipora subatra]|uniref:DNA repair protein RAD50.L-like isoform X2 n=1 Tax=Watersipora subatra TaxID=2589382 RepID=UPI00355AE2CE
MATLEILEIRGIRSFGPLEAQRLKFIKPVTLIHGPNGTGKTTIIECLRYATTGDQPPNTKGGAFLYDPKLSDESTIKAQVKLQFSCVTGEQALVSRSQQAMRKGNSVTAKTVDTALKRKLKNGGEAALDSRCADINAEMKHALGVSAPILQNVIFCHQEESNWPLSEGKALKQKFDDIFASTRYVKALDNITKIRKAKVKEKKERAERELNKATENSLRVEEDIKPIEGKLEQIAKELQKITDVTVELVRKKHSRDLLRKDAEEIKDSLKGSLFNGSKVGLEKALEEFELEMSQKGKLATDTQGKLNHTLRSIEKLVDAEKQLLGVHAKCKLEQEGQQSNISKRDGFVKELVRDYELPGVKSILADLTDGRLEKFNKLIGEKETRMSDSIKDEKAEFELKEQEIQKKLDDARKRKSELETTCKMKRERLGNNKAEVRKLNLQLGDVETSSGRLDNLVLDLNQTEKELERHLSSMDAAASQTTLQQLQKERDSMRERLTQLKEELSTANSLMKERTSLDMLKDSKKEKLDQLATLRQRVEETVLENFGEFPTSNLKRRVDDIASLMSEEIKGMTAQLNERNMDLHSLDMKLTAKTETLNTTETNISNIKKKISEVCDIDKFEDTQAEMVDQIAAAQDNRGLLHGVKEMFARYHRILTDTSRPKAEQKCPLCKRQFSEEEEVDELAAELSRHVEGLPARMESSERELISLQSKQEKLQHLVPQRQQLQQLQKEAPSYRADILDIKRQIDEKKSAVAKLEGEVAMKQDDEESLKAILPDVYKIDSLQVDIDQLEKRITNQEKSMGELTCTRSVEDITNDQEEEQMKHDTTSMKVDRMTKKLSSYNENLMRLRSKVNDLGANKLKIQESVQQKCTLEQQKAALLDENSKLQREVETLQDDLCPMDYQIQTILTDKRELLSGKDSKLDALNKQMQQLRHRIDELSKVQSAIDRYTAEEKAQELAKTDRDLQKLREKTKECQEIKEEQAKEINNLNKLIAEQKMRERELKDNLRYRDKLEEAELCAKEVEEINVKLGGLDPSKLSSQQKVLSERLDELKKEQATSAERMRNWQEQFNTHSKELKNEGLKDAAQVYMKHSVALQVNKLVVTDLDKYHKALDRAILEYHQKKMDDLNRIIHKLWKETYRGHDIDYIEICSDDASGGSAEGDVEAVDISKRKTYNYRVVMIRNGIQMDMRGRCSAGQKVLASLIIRLALAETFCLSCGILALDEPTTNLDVENIESLAHALSEIISARKRQQNFQLIIITHDTQFVEILGRRVGVEEYYKIGKNVSGQSELKRSSIDDIVY